MDHDLIKELIPAYALGAIDDDEHEVVNAHLEDGCDDCEALLEEMRQVAGTLVYSSPSKAPPPQIKEQIFSQIEPDSSVLAVRQEKKSPGPLEIQLQRLQKSRQKWMSLSWALGFALIAVAVGFSLFTLRLKESARTSEHQIQLSDLLIQQLRSELANKDQILQVIKSPRVRMVDLQGQEPARDAGGKVVWDPDRRQAVFYVHNLPPATSDQDYQLWMLRGNQTIDAGVFPVDSQGASQPLTFDTIADTPNLSAFAVTLEPKGGVSKPTGNIYLLGAVTSP